MLFSRPDSPPEDVAAFDESAVALINKYASQAGLSATTNVVQFTATVRQTMSSVQVPDGGVSQLKVDIETLRGQKAAAAKTLSVPPGRPNPQWRQDIMAQVTALNEQLRGLDSTDPRSDQIKAQMKALTDEAVRLEAAGG